ncbi:hypothetical protein AVEN_71195-1 [Araneus ventricosus]|uniref:Uncharacterized protein n=1 Tax=Araneus ventricosus TaxID=182803 RepID=A0A4Y2HR27_ARAVE|nr:hypothetical protein AVEN_71195-1 [Araneus ventricosus]
MIEVAHWVRENGKGHFMIFYAQKSKAEGFVVTLSHYHAIIGWKNGGNGWVILGERICPIVIQVWASVLGLSIEIMVLKYLDNGFIISVTTVFCLSFSAWSCVLGTKLLTH